MNFYVVKFPEKKDRVFSSIRDAKNCLSNLGPIHLGTIIHYKGRNNGKTVGIINENKRKWIYDAL